jgi:hypothetical protein
VKKRTKQLLREREERAELGGGRVRAVEGSCEVTGKLEMSRLVFAHRDMCRSAGTVNQGFDEQEDSLTGRRECRLPAEWDT